MKYLKSQKSQKKKWITANITLISHIVPYVIIIHRTLKNKKKPGGYRMFLINTLNLCN